MPLTLNIPQHLKKYVVEQDYSKYTPIDQAVWRYTLRQLKFFLSRNAHNSYLSGLEKTGISINKIPSISEISEKLKPLGWIAVPVSGFIPPAAFMEMQSLSILPIASDMRTIDHILYTPAPDIVHEAAGHAPMLANEDYSNYLKKYSLISKHALISHEDLEQYEAIRELSDIKEDPSASHEQVKEAENKLESVNKNMKNLSEASLLSRMNWWTAEYGLVGDFSAPKIYGAGLLSSVGESRDCLTDKVKKIPLTIDCIKTAYDITEPQPQLFVCPDLKSLTCVLDDLAELLAFKRGGIYGLEKAIETKTVNTVLLNTGLQISGKLVEILKDENGNPIYLRFDGPSQLGFEGKEIPGHGVNYHSHGFGSPLENFENNNDWKLNSELSLTLSSGVKLTGKLIKFHTSVTGEKLIASFENCSVMWKNKILFEPSWGTYDMALGDKVTSVYAGPCDRFAYGETDNFVNKKVPPKKFSESQLMLHSLYQKLRDARENNKFDDALLKQIFNDTKDINPAEWLLFLELYEIALNLKIKSSFADILKEYLNSIGLSRTDLRGRIEDGLKIAHLEL